MTRSRALTRAVRRLPKLTWQTGPDRPAVVPVRVTVVDALGLTVHEIRETLRACAHVRVPDPVPPYLQRFLVLRLEHDHSPVAAKIAHLPPDRCTELFRLIRALQRSAHDA